MKKILAFVLFLCFLVALCAVAALAESNDLHTLWSIPWDATSDNLVDTVYEITGIAIKENGLVDNVFQIVDIQKVELLGNEVSSSLFLTYGDGNTLSSISLIFDADELPKSKILLTPNDINIRESTGRFDKIVQAFVEKYGAPDAVQVHCYMDSMLDTGRITYSVDILPDEDIYHTLKALALEHNYALVRLYFNNIRILYTIQWAGPEEHHTKYNVAFEANRIEIPKADAPLPIIEAPIINDINMGI